MQFELLIGLTSLLYVYQRTFIEPIDARGRNRLYYLKIDVKPFNCVFCVSFWLSLTTTILTNDPIYLSIPLIYRIIQLKLIR